MLSANSQVPRSSFSSLRILSALKLLLGAFIVIGHNVFHVVPNEVPILFVLGLLSIRWRDGGWSAIGFKRLASWVRVVLLALAAAALRIILGDLVIEPLAGHFWPPIVSPAGTEAITGNIKSALIWLLLVWTWAAFGEEFGYRGYLLTRAADIGGRTTAAIGSELLSSPFCLVTGIITKVQPVSWIRELQDWFWGPLHVIGPESMGQRSGSRVYRHVWSDYAVLRIGVLIRWRFARKLTNVFRRSPCVALHTENTANRWLPESWS